MVYITDGLLIFRCIDLTTSGASMRALLANPDTIKGCTYMELAAALCVLPLPERCRPAGDDTVRVILDMRTCMHHHDA